MNSRDTNSGLQLKGRIDTRVHDVDDLRASVDDYDSLSDEEKMELTRQVQPTYTDTVYNVTTDNLHEYFVDNLDPDQSGASADVSASWLGLGTGGSTAVATSDTDLTTRTYEEAVTDVADNGKELLASTFLDSTEGNGNDFDELGLFSGDISGIPSGDVENSAPADVFLLNHATFNTVTKDSSKTVTFDVTLTFSDA